MRFSANLGFLWSELPLPEAIRAARDHGFAAVECHWPYDTPAEDTARALRETGLPMISLNTHPGRDGDFGLAALSGREVEAQAGIDRALDYARAVNAEAVHVMAGFARGEAAHESFIANLSHACRAAEGDGIAVLIEPLNPHDAPGYFLNSTAQAVSIISQIGARNLRLMFDCYHVQRIEGDLTRRLTALLPVIGHIQFAAVPDRGPPDGGEVNYRHVFSELARLGYEGALGAEYRPQGRTEDSLGWMKSLATT